MARSPGSRFATPTLRKRRSATGLTLTAFAVQHGIVISKLSQVETGNARATVELQASISVALGSDVDELFAPVDSPAERAWLSITEAATESRLSYETIAAAIRGDELPDMADSGRAGGTPHRIPREEFEAWLVAREAAALRLSLSAASELTGWSRETLRLAASEKIVGYAETFLDSRGRRHYRFDRTQLLDDLERLPTCAYNGCEARALHPNGGCPGHSAIIATPRGHSTQTRARIGRALLGVRKSEEHRAALKAERTTRSAHLERELLAQVGACGSPGCHDQTCSVQAGRCHRVGCGNEATIAGQTHYGRGLVRSYPRAYCSAHSLLLDFTDLRAKARWYLRRFESTKLFGVLGAAEGIEAGRAKGGRPVRWGTAEETAAKQRRILELDREKRSTREIAVDVFGDERQYLRVWRFLNR